MKKTILVLLATIFILSDTNAQKYSDAVYLFKMVLFLDKDNVTFNGMDTNTIKNDSLYNVFKDYYTISLDTLKVTNELDFPDSYEFFKLNMDKAKASRRLHSDEGQYIGIFVGSLYDYILAINMTTGICYRLKGFRSNDFLMLFADFKESYKEERPRKKKLSFSDFLSGFKVEELDFECLYKGLRAEEIDSRKYPCLKRCSDPY